MLAAIAAVVAPRAAAQSSPIAPKFEVVSVKPCAADGAGAGGRRNASAGGSPGKLDLSCRTVMSIIQTAYTSGMPPLPPIEGGPSWINSERYVINAISNPPVAVLDSDWRIRRRGWWREGHTIPKQVIQLNEP